MEKEEFKNWVNEALIQVLLISIAGIVLCIIFDDRTAAFITSVFALYICSLGMLNNKVNSCQF